MAIELEDHLAAFVLACAFAASCTGADEGSARPDPEAGSDVAFRAEGGRVDADASGADVSIEGSAGDVVDGGDARAGDGRDAAVEASAPDDGAAGAGIAAAV